MKIQTLNNIQFDITPKGGSEPILSALIKGDEVKVESCDKLVPPNCKKIVFENGDTAQVKPAFWKAVKVIA